MYHVQCEVRSGKWVSRRGTRRTVPCCAVLCCAVLCAARNFSMPTVLVRSCVDMRTSYVCIQLFAPHATRSLSRLPVPAFPPATTATAATTWPCRCLTIGEALAHISTVNQR